VNATAQGDNWKTKPNMAACGSSHDNVYFGVQPDPAKPYQTKPHSGGVIADDGTCALCHAVLTQYKLPGTYAPIASWTLLKKAADKAEQMGLDYKDGNLFSSDSFYDDANSGLEWQKMGILAVEMESVALYANAARAGKNALCICTISDLLFSDAACTPEERQTSFTQMMELALEIA
jgi:purine-nucleoside phosphorylase